jgi:hypothetical protein
MTALAVSMLTACAKCKPDRRVPASILDDGVFAFNATAASSASTLPVMFPMDFVL